MSFSRENEIYRELEPLFEHIEKILAEQESKVMKKAYGELDEARNILRDTRHELREVKRNLQAIGRSISSVEGLESTSKSSDQLLSDYYAAQIKLETQQSALEKKHTENLAKFMKKIYKYLDLYENNNTKEYNDIKKLTDCNLLHTLVVGKANKAFPEALFEKEASQAPTLTAGSLTAGYRAIPIPKNMPHSDSEYGSLTLKQPPPGGGVDGSTPPIDIDTRPPASSSTQAVAGRAASTASSTMPPPKPPTFIVEKNGPDGKDTNELEREREREREEPKKIGKQNAQAAWANHLPPPLIRDIQRP